MYDGRMWSARAALRVSLVTVACAVLAARPARAQDADLPDDHQHPAAARPSATSWTWAADANLFYGYNYQQRKYADFSAWESQNWVMASGERPLGAGRLT